jgi:hypothetical protein
VSENSLDSLSWLIGYLPEQVRESRETRLALADFPRDLG